MRSARDKSLGRRVHLTLNTNAVHHMLIIAGLPVIGSLLDIDLTNSLQSVINMAKDYRTSPTAACYSRPPLTVQSQQISSR